MISAISRRDCGPEVEVVGCVVTEEPVCLEACWRSSPRPGDWARAWTAPLPGTIHGICRWGGDSVGDLGLLFDIFWKQGMYSSRVPGGVSIFQKCPNYQYPTLDRTFFNKTSWGSLNPLNIMEQRYGHCCTSPRPRDLHGPTNVP